MTATPPIRHLLHSPHIQIHKSNAAPLQQPLHANSTHLSIFMIPKRYINASHAESGDYSRVYPVTGDKAEKIEPEMAEMSEGMLTPGEPSAPEMDVREETPFEAEPSVPEQQEQQQDTCTEFEPLVFTLARDDESGGVVSFSCPDILELPADCTDVIMDLWQCIPTSSPFRFENRLLLEGCVMRMQQVNEHDYCTVLWQWEGMEMRLSHQKEGESPAPTEVPQIADDSQRYECTIESHGTGIQEELFWLMTQQMDGSGSIREHVHSLRETLSKPIKGYYATTDTIPEEEPAYENDDTLLDKLYRSIHTLFTFISTYQEEVPLSISYQRILPEYIRTHLYVPIRTMLLDGLLPPPQIEVDSSGAAVDVGVALDKDAKLKAWKYLKDPITQILSATGRLSILEDRIEKCPENERFYAFLESALVESQLADWMNRLIILTAKRNLEGLLSYQKFGNMATVNRFLGMCKRLDRMSFQLTS